MSVESTAPFIASAATAAITAIGTWFVAKQQLNQKHVEVMPAELNIIIKTWQDELSRLTKRVDQLQDDNARLQKKNDSYRLEIAELREAITRLQSQQSPPPR